MKQWLHKQLEDIIIRLRMKKYKRDKFFRVADEFDGLLPIEILEGAYKGTVFTVSGIQMIDDCGKCKFDHEVIRRPANRKPSYYGDQFSKLVGEILLICIADAMNNYQQVRKEVLEDETNNDCYIEEPVEERTVPAKGTRVPKT